MRRTITAHLYDEYEPDKQVYDLIHGIWEKTHKPYGQILVELLSPLAERTRISLSDEDKSRIAAAVSENVLEGMKQFFPAYVAGYAEKAPVPRRVPEAEIDLSTAIPRDQNLGETDLDFSGSSMDFGFMGS